MQAKLSKYKQRYYRLKTGKQDTPQKVVNHLPRGQKCSPEVRKRLTFGEAINKQIKINYQQQKGLKKRNNYFVMLLLEKL